MYLCKYFGDYYTNQKARPLNSKMANADTLDGAGVNSGNALDAAKVRRKSENTKKIEKQRDFKAPQALSGDTELTARAANVLNSAAKVQNKSEITKLSKKKKELPPSSRRTRT